MSTKIVAMERRCEVAPLTRATGRADADGLHHFEATLSSDFERPMWNQVEVLSHADGAVDLGLVNGGRAYVQADGHWSDVAIGRIEPSSVRLEGGKLHATLRIVDDDNGPGHHAIARIAGEVARSLSIDYEWLDWSLRKRDSDNVEIIDVSRWRLRGVSLVVDPADDSAAIGEERKMREAKKAIRDEGERADGEDMPEDDSERMDDEEHRDGAEDGEVRDEPEAGAEGERKRRSAADPAPHPTPKPKGDPFADSMSAIAREHDAAMAVVGKRELRDELRADIARLRADAEGAVRHGRTHEAGTLQVAILQRLAAESDDTGVRLSKEFQRGADGQVQRDASHSPLIRNMIEAEARSGLSVEQMEKGMRSIGFGESRGYEVGALQEMGDAARSAMSGDAAGVFASNVVPIPFSMWVRSLARHEPDAALAKKMRGFSVGDTTKGSALVDTDILISEWVDNLYASAMLREVGARQMMGLTSNITIPRITSKITPAFATENGQLTLDDHTIAGTTTAPHRIGVAFDITHQLNIQTAGAADGIVMQVMMSSSMEEIDRQCIVGTGTDPAVTGLKSISGITASTLANLGTATSAQLYTWLVNLVQGPSTRNVPRPYAMLMSEALVAHLRDAPRNSGGGDGYIFENGMINGIGEIPVARTTMLTLTATEEAVFVGNWSNFILCEYGAPMLIEDSLTRAREGEKRTTMQRWIDVIDVRTADLQAGPITVI